MLNTHPLALLVCIFAAVVARKDRVPRIALDSKVSSAVLQDRHPRTIMHLGFTPLSELACVTLGAVQTQIKDVPPQSSDSTQDWQFCTHSSH